jgi:hypothetical protein
VWIAAAQLAVSSLGFEELLTLRGEELDEAVAIARETLDQARSIITSRV